MLRFRYTIDLFEHLPFGDGKRPLETHTGTILAEDYSSAKEKVWPLITKRGEELHKQHGVIVAYGNVQIALVQEGEGTATITLADYQQAHEEGRQLAPETQILTSAAELSQSEMAQLNAIFTEIKADLATAWHKHMCKPKVVEATAHEAIVMRDKPPAPDRNQTCSLTEQ